MDISVIFRLIVERVIKKWPAIVLSLDLITNCEDKVDWLISIIVKEFLKGRLVDEEVLSSYLDEIMYNEFNISVEDSSCHVLASNFIDYYDECLNGRGEQILEELDSKLANHAPIIEFDKSHQENSTDDTGSSEDEKANKLHSIESSNFNKCETSPTSEVSKRHTVDEDGWFVFKQKK